MENTNVQMLNINDIHKKNALKNIPKEIEETRNLITDSFKNLKFVEDCHKYFIVNDNNEVELPSVSSIITQWVPEVDWDEKAELKAAKLGITAEELKKQWHEKNIISTHCGSKTHFFGEQAMNMLIGREDLTKSNMPFQYTDDGYLIPYCPKEWAITRYYNDILNNKDVFPVMPEAKIYTNYNSVYVLKQPYAGTFDILLGYRYKGDIVYSIQDLKTNADLYKDYSHVYNIMMKSPFDMLDFYEEPYYHYVIQLNCYQIGLMQLGIKIVDRTLIWLKEDGVYEKVKVPDITDTLLEIL